MLGISLETFDILEIMETKGFGMDGENITACKVLLKSKEYSWKCLLWQSRKLFGSAMLLDLTKFHAMLFENIIMVKNK